MNLPYGCELASPRLRNRYTIGAHVPAERPHMTGAPESIIRQPFLSLAGHYDEAAVLQIPAGRELVVSVDTLVEGVHFPAATAPRDLGHKALAVNLSDLAAMGAEPTATTLAVLLPEERPDWSDEFGLGFLSLAERFGVRLMGLAVSRGALTITVHVYGTTPRGQALTRSAARPGDRIYVTGSLGDAGVALQAIQGVLAPEHAMPPSLAQRLDRPEPRIAEGIALRGIATSAIDVSDGLAADLGHLLEAGGVGARLQMARIPVSPWVYDTLGEDKAWHAALASGDDYELCFTVPPERADALEKGWQHLKCPLTPVGVIEQAPGLRCLRPDGSELHLGSRGYEHF